MLVRLANEKDLDQVHRIYNKFYADDFPAFLRNAFSPITVEEDGQVLSFGWLEFTLESTILLNLEASPRKKFAALGLSIEAGLESAKRAGFDQIHAFPLDERFAKILEKHYGFRRTNALVRNVNG